MKKINPSTLTDIIAQRDFDALLELIQPYIASPKTRGRPRTVGKADMTPEQLREYNRRMKAAERAAAKAAAEKEAAADMALQQEADAAMVTAQAAWQQYNVE